MSGWGKFLFWSTVLSLPTIFFIPKKKPGVVEPGPEETGPDGEPIVLEPSAPPEPFDTIPADFKNFKTPVELAGYTRMKDSEVPASVRPLLPPLLGAPGSPTALGTVTKLPTEGRDIAADIEPHYHTPGGPIKPWGWHRGVSLYERKGAVA